MCKEELTHFLALTSLKGVGRAVKTEETWLRVMWICAVVIFLGFTVYQGYTLTQAYLRHPTTTSIQEESVDFTNNTDCDIMLCNINPFSSKRLNETLNTKKTYEELILSWTANDEVVDNQNWTAEEVVQTLNHIRQELLTGQLGLYQHVGAAEASELSHGLSNFILSCYAHYVDGVMERKLPCVEAGVKVKRIVHKEYFNCYKFYGEVETTAPLPYTGISFLLYIDDPRHSAQGKGLSLQKVGKGALMTLGEETTFLDPDSRGIEIIPNFVNVVRVQQSRRVRLPAPYGNCKDREAIKDTDSYRLKFTYTRDTCYSACVEYEIVKKCQCHDVGQYGTLRSMFRNISMCGVTDEGRQTLLERMKCVQDLRNALRKRCLAQCVSPCQETRLSHQVSYLELLPQEVIKSLVLTNRTVPDVSTEKHLSSLVPTEKIDPANVAWVIVKRESDSFFLIQDQIGITFYDLLSKLGGTFNLWSGITMFVFVELLDFFCRICNRKFCREKQQPSLGNNNPDVKSLDAGKSGKF